MSLDALNRIVGEAIVNAAFCRKLLADPGAAVRDYELGREELELLSSIHAGSVDNLAQQLIAGLGLERKVVARPQQVGGHSFAASSGQAPARCTTQPTRTLGPLSPAVPPALYGKPLALPSTC